MSGEPLRIATRASRLALWQARHVAGLLEQACPQRGVELVEVSTSGDRDRNQSLQQLGGAGVFTKEIQRAVLECRADVAVHSLKDLPTERAEGLILAAVPARAAANDVLVLPESEQRPGGAVDSLPDAARVGTGSPRRRAQLLHHRPDLRLTEVRGNVETRLSKLDGGQFDALILAEAGLTRLELAHRISRRLGPPVLYPAVGQGALGIECRSDDEECLALLENLNEPRSKQAVLAERGLLAELRAGCHAPLGVWSTVKGDQLTLEGVVLSLDGRERLAASETGPLQNGEVLGHRAAHHLREQGADALIAGSRPDRNR